MDRALSVGRFNFARIFWLLILSSLLRGLVNPASANGEHTQNESRAKSGSPVDFSVGITLARKASSPATPTLENVQALLASPQPWNCRSDFNQPENDHNQGVELFKTLKPGSAWESRFGKTAESELTTAVNNNDHDGVFRVAHHYRFTQAGDRALSRIVSYLVDRAEFEAAALYAQTVTKDAESELCPGQVFSNLGVLAILAFEQTGRNEQKKQLVERLKACPTPQGSHQDWIAKIERINQIPAHTPGVSLEIADKVWSKEMLRRAVTYSNTRSPIGENKIASFCRLYADYSTEDLITLSAKDEFELGAHIQLLMLAKGEVDAQRIVSFFESELKHSPNAIDYLGKIGRPALKPLISALGHEELTVQRVAARSLSFLGKDAEAAVESLAPLLSHPDFELRNAVAGALWASGPKGIRALTEALSGEQKPRDAAVRQFGHCGEEGEKILIETLLKHHLADARLDSAHELQRSLREKLENSPDIVNAFLKALEDPKEFVVRAAIEALGDPGSPSAVPKLTALLKEGKYISYHAALALGKIRDPSVIPALTKALEEDSDWPRKGATFAIGAFGEKAKAAVPALIKILEQGKKDGSNTIVREAAMSLGQIGDPAAIPALEKIVKDQSLSELARNMALDAIVRIKYP